ncbi:MAG: orotidine 5'-phosphate decarboxylase [Chloroflexi bacterium RBG_13_51_36]|nr:MAG: orotidine 5'-phosphate decarboxylase [Chloroflexi bacterium RBG_13_51_36]
MSFFEKLAIASRKNSSLLCVGLDPDPQMKLSNADNVVAFNSLIIKATVDLACAYKPNLAIYESMGIEGLSALQETLNLIRQADPCIPIIGDGKRGDIGTCSTAYAKTLLEDYDFDAVTVNPYMGSDALKPFLEHKEKGVFVLCRTSNPSGMQIQELMVVRGGVRRPLYQIVAELALSWNWNRNVGLVVGATYPEQISRVREICPDMLFLIPGVGVQGGSIEKTVRSAADTQGEGFIINVSRQIMYAAKTPIGTRSKDSEAMRKMRHVARQLRDEINSYLPSSLKKNLKQICQSHEDQANRGESYRQTESSVMATSGR